MENCEKIKTLELKKKEYAKPIIDGLSVAFWVISVIFN